MTTKTWTGTAGIGWNLNGNWSPFGVPTINDDVIFPSFLILNRYNIIGATMEAKSITFSGFNSNPYTISGDTLTIGSGASIINNTNRVHTFNCLIDCFELELTISGVSEIGGIIFNNNINTGDIIKQGLGKLVFSEGIVATVGTVTINNGSFNLVTNLPSDLTIANGASLYLYDIDYYLEAVAVSIFGTPTLNSSSSIYMIIENISNYSSLYTDNGFTLTMAGALYLDLNFSSGLTDGTYNLFTGDKIGNFSSIELLNTINEFSDITFSYNGSLWVSTFGSTNKYFTFNNVTGDLILITMPITNISSTLDWNNDVGNTTIQIYHLVNDIIFYGNIGNNGFGGNLQLQSGAKFDGKNNAIYLTNINNFNGLFNLNSASMNTNIKNLIIYSENVTLNDNCGYIGIGTLDGSIQSNGSFNNVKVVIKNSIMGNNCGGIIGAFGRNIKINNSCVSGSISGSNSGGLIGNNCLNANIYNSYVIGNVSSDAGSLIGNNSTVNNIKDSYFAGIQSSNITLSGTTIVNSKNVYSVIIEDLIF